MLAATNPTWKYPHRQPATDRGYNSIDAIPEETIRILYDVTDRPQGIQLGVEDENLAGEGSMDMSE